MSAPLYKDSQAPRQCEGNYGLWFDRFYDQYEERDWSILKPTTHDNKLGNTYWLTKHFNNQKVGVAQELESHCEAQKSLASSLGGQSLVFKSFGHFVTGMGNPHPVDNGFAWHPTLGVPYLTGAAVKGLVRSYIETNLREDAESGNPEKKLLLLDWFGSNDKDPSVSGYESKSGELIFFDALPVEPVTLGVDVMTPHMGKWYEKGGTEPNTPETVPADWHDPVPVSFLVAKDISLQFSFGFRQYDTQGEKCPEIDLGDVAEVLERVLGEMGAGAKTATGYGGLFDQQKLKDKKAEDARAQALTNATKYEGYYLKVDLRNGSLFLEKGREKGVARTSGSAAEAILASLPDEQQSKLKSGKGVKVIAWVNKEMVSVELFK